MAVDQHPTFQAPDPFPPTLMCMFATASRATTVLRCEYAVVARPHPAGVVSGRRTGGTGDATTTVVGPAIHSKSETVRLQCEPDGRGVVGCPREEGSA